MSVYEFLYHSSGCDEILLRFWAHARQGFWYLIQNSYNAPHGLRVFQRNEMYYRIAQNVWYFRKKNNTEISNTAISVFITKSTHTVYFYFFSRKGCQKLHHLYIEAEEHQIQSATMDSFLYSSTKMHSFHIFVCMSGIFFFKVLVPL